MGDAWYVMPWLLDEETHSSGVKVSKFWLALVSFGGTVVASYLISYCFPRPDPEKLKGLTVWDQS